MILDFDDFDLLKLVTYWPIFSKFRGDPVKKTPCTYMYVIVSMGAHAFKKYMVIMMTKQISDLKLEIWEV